MARDMNTVPDFIRDQTVGSFAVFIRDPTPTALSMRFPPIPSRASPTCAPTNRGSSETAIANCMRATSRFGRVRDPPQEPDAPPSRRRRETARSRGSVATAATGRGLLATARDTRRRLATAECSEHDKIILCAHRASLPNIPEHSRACGTFTRRIRSTISLRMQTATSTQTPLASLASRTRQRASGSPTPTSATSSNRSRATGD